MTQKSGFKQKGILGIIMVLLAVAVLACGCTHQNNSEGSVSDGSTSEPAETSERSDSTASEKPQSDSESDGEQKSQEKEKEQKPAQPVGDLLAQAAYYGDRASCQMTSDMAKAYQEALEALPQTMDAYLTVDEYFDGALKAALLDVSDDGYPILATFYQGANDVFGENCVNEVTIWEYRDGKAQEIKPSFEIGYSDLYVDSSSTPSQLVFQDGEMFDVGQTNDFHVYSVSKGQVSYQGTYQHRGGHSPDGVIVDSYVDLGKNECADTTVEDLLNQGWQWGDYWGENSGGILECMYYNEEPLKESIGSILNKWTPIGCFYYGGEYKLDSSPAADMIQALKAVSSS